METWEPYNYYTTNPEEWVKLMNFSTTEWNIGFLPLGVVAIPGTLNSSYNFSAGTLVIENASRTNFGSRDIEKVIFGASAGVVLLWALLWFTWHWKRNTLLSPRGYTDHDEAEGGGGGGGGGSDHLRATSPSGTTVFGGYGGNGFMAANLFEEELDVFYEDVQTELELQEKVIRSDGVSAEDVEGGTELIRKLYYNKLGLWASQDTSEITEEDRDLLAEENDFLVQDLRSLVASWTAQQNAVGWTEDEMQELRQLSVALKQLSP